MLVVDDLAEDGKYSHVMEWSRIGIPESMKGWLGLNLGLVLRVPHEEVGLILGVVKSNMSLKRRATSISNDLHDVRDK